MKCSAEQDLMFVLDGSGSLYPASSDDAENGNFVIEKNFVKSIIENSDEANVRFAIVVSGGDERPHVVSTYSSSHATLNSALDNVEWPQGETHLGAALETASHVMQLSDASTRETRHETVVLITDGRSRERRASVAAAGELKTFGVRVLIVLVQDTGDVKADASDDLLCSVASSPCQDHVLRVDRWADLASQLSRVLAAACPVAFNPEA
jgi:Mg-chelatase subunit ChlD